MGHARICRGDYVLVVAWLWCGGFFFKKNFKFFYLLWPVLKVEGEREENKEKKRNSKKNE